MMETAELLLSLSVCRDGEECFSASGCVSVSSCYPISVHVHRQTSVTPQTLNRAALTLLLSLFVL